MAVWLKETFAGQVWPRAIMRATVFFLGQLAINLITTALVALLDLGRYDGMKEIVAVQLVGSIVLCFFVLPWLTGESHATMFWFVCVISFGLSAGFVALMGAGGIEIPIHSHMLRGLRFIYLPASFGVALWFARLQNSTWKFTPYLTVLLFIPILILMWWISLRMWWMIGTLF